MAKNQAHKEAILEFDEVEIIVRIYPEWRQDTRFALNAKGGIIRHPVISLKGEAGYLKDFTTWIKQVFLEKPHLLKRYSIRSYEEGNTIHVMGDEYVFSYSQNKSFRLIGNQIELPENSLHEYSREELKKVISKLFVKKYSALVIQKVHDWNNQHFQSKINRVTLRYTQSRWGSCSTKKNISLSSKLLLAPKEVLDYVIVHELAHTYEMNHSSRFWARVASVMPNYQHYEKMLKEEGGVWDF